MTSARDLTARLASLLRDERNALADFLVLLSDFDRRRLWLELGHPGLFSFLHRELGLSKSAAHYRKTAAELVQRFPSAVEPLRDGRLCLTTVFELSKVATPENLDEVLPRFFHLSKREAAEVAAEILPDEAPPRRDVVTVVRAPARTATLPCAEAAPVLLAELPHANSAPPPAAMMSQATAPTASPALPTPPRAPVREARTVTEPLTADLRRSLRRARHGRQPPGALPRSQRVRRARVVRGRVDGSLRRWRCSPARTRRTMTRAAGRPMPASPARRGPSSPAAGSPRRS